MAACGLSSSTWIGSCIEKIHLKINLWINSTQQVSQNLMIKGHKLKGIHSLHENQLHVNYIDHQVSEDYYESWILSSSNLESLLSA